MLAVEGFELIDRGSLHSSQPLIRWQGPVWMSGGIDRLRKGMPRAEIRVLHLHAQVALQLRFHLRELVCRERRFPQLLRHQANQQRGMLLETLPAKGNSLRTRGKPHSRTNAIELFGDRKLVLLLRALVEHQSHERGDCGIAAIAGMYIARRQRAHYGDNILRTHGVHVELDAGRLRVNDSLADASGRCRNCAERRKGGGQTEECSAEQCHAPDEIHCVTVGMNQPVVLRSSMRYSCATRCTSALVTRATCSRNVK